MGLITPRIWVASSRENGKFHTPHSVTAELSHYKVRKKADRLTDDSGSEERLAAGGWLQSQATDVRSGRPKGQGPDGSGQRKIRVALCRFHEVVSVLGQVWT